MRSGPIFAFAFCCLAWGSCFLAVKEVLNEGVPVFAMIASRFVLASVFLLGFGVFKRQLLPTDNRKAFFVKVPILSAFLLILPIILSGYGANMVSSGLAAVVNSTMPLFCFVFSALLLKNGKSSWVQIGGLLLGFLGVFCLLSESFGSDDEGGSPVVGALLTMAAAACVGFATVFGKMSGSNEFSARLIMTWAMVVGAVCAVAGSIVLDGFDWIGSMRLTPALWIVYLSVTGTALPYLLYYWLLEKWNENRVAVIAYILPLIAVVMGIVFLQEAFSVYMAIGMTAIILGVVAVSRGGKSEQEEEEVKKALPLKKASSFFRLAKVYPDAEPPSVYSEVARVSELERVQFPQVRAPFVREVVAVQPDSPAASAYLNA